jgi:subtilisin family serine protease
VRRAALAACALVLAAPATADAARFAVGVAPGADLEAVALEVEGITASPVSRELAPMRALLVDARRAAPLGALPGVEYVERLDRSRRVAFVPDDPLAPRQWYLAQSHAFDFWPELPILAGVRVAVIDSGIDARHPELAGRVLYHRSFVGGSALTDQQGHGTFVAGMIAAETGNGEGIAGMAFPARLIVAKVVAANRSVSLEAEARAIRWAVDRGARVINLSLGGLRDPRNRQRDTYSPLEAAAVRYAYSKGATVVAAVGNADQAPQAPWPFASYPAALPHVIGVSAFARGGNVPVFSNRDPIYNDLSAPGQEIVSTFPRHLTAQRPSCDEQGYSLCGPDEYRRAEGTSFAAPQVTAAAAMMLSLSPELLPDQISWLLTRTADDAGAVNGCARCAPGRDELTGWGRLNVARALTGAATPPAPDRYETNDDAGPEAFRLWGAKRNITATVDFWDDQVDVYSVRLAKGERLRATLDGPFRATSSLVLWKPGTKRLDELSLSSLRRRVAQSARRGWRQRITYRAKAPGWYFLQIKVASLDAGPYRLIYSKSRR